MREHAFPQTRAHAFPQMSSTVGLRRMQRATGFSQWIPQITNQCLQQYSSTAWTAKNTPGYNERCRRRPLRPLPLCVMLLQYMQCRPPYTQVAPLLLYVPTICDSKPSPDHALNQPRTLARFRKHLVSLQSQKDQNLEYSSGVGSCPAPLSWLAMTQKPQSKGRGGERMMGKGILLGEGQACCQRKGWPVELGIGCVLTPEGRRQEQTKT